MKLSIIILNYNVRHFLELCIKSVQSALIDIDSEIIVVDNHSNDGSCKMVKQQFPDVKLIENSENFGFSKGNNIAVKHSKGDYICILNPDTVVAEDTFKLLLHFSEEKENLGIIGCRLIDGKGQFLPESKRYIPTPKVAIRKILGFTDGYYVNTLDQFSNGKAPILVGAFMFLKRSIYDEVNGFDEAYFMYGEDIDLSYKVLKAGYENMYFGQTTVIHYKGESTLKDKTYAKRFYGAMQIFYNTHFQSNVIFDSLVWLGTKSAPLFQKSVSKETDLKKRRILISSEMSLNSKSKLLQQLPKQSSIKTYKDDAEYVLDNNHLSFKRIIEMISSIPKNCGATFKILPKNSNFIIGSNSSKGRGEVIPLEDN